MTGVAFLAISLVWLRFSPIYDSAIVSGANALLPADLWLSRFGGTLTVRIVTDAKEYGLAVDALMLHSWLIIVLALVAGVPLRSWVWRGGAAGIVVILFYVLHVTGMAVYAVTLQRVLVGENLLGDVQMGLAIFGGAQSPGDWWSCDIPVLVAGVPAPGEAAGLTRTVAAAAADEVSRPYTVSIAANWFAFTQRWSPGIPNSLMVLIAQSTP